MEDHPSRLPHGRQIHQLRTAQHPAEETLVDAATLPPVRELLEPIQESLLQRRLHQLVRLQHVIRQDAVAFPPRQTRHHGFLVAHHHRPRTALAPRGAGLVHTPPAAPCFPDGLVAS